MIQIEEYKVLLGHEIKNFLDGAISFEELEDRISKGNLHSSIKKNEIIKLTWHAIYQYETDVDMDDRDYAEAITNKMRQISSALINNDSQVSKHLDNYFNDPKAI